MASYLYALMNIKRHIVVAMLLLTSISLSAQRKPLIGISTGGNKWSSSVNSTYYDAVRRAGGIPVLIPQVDNDAQAKETIKRLDGIVFTGGEDFDPRYYGEERIPEIETINGFRDTSDIALAHAALKAKLPILAICRGEQLMNIVMGGSLWQDIPSQYGTDVRHRQEAPSSVPTHTIVIDKKSTLYFLLQADTVMVNSFHHEGVKILGDGLKAVAVAPDGIVEAFENANSKSHILATQFHPEGLARADEKWIDIFRWLIAMTRR
jgi:Predicted glutamine amidotransferases